ncbi:MAG: ROK family protein, partial [Solimonas sp.]
DTASRLLQHSNILVMNGRALARDVHAAVGATPVVENDANCFAMAEASRGAGVGKRLVLGIVLGTGCGGGIVHDRRLHTGPHGTAGEWGHVQLDPNGPDCYCGKRGCIERYVSGTALSQAYQRSFGEIISSEMLIQRSRAGDQKAGSILRSFLEAFGKALAGVLTILDPDIVVIGGGLSNISELYAEGVNHVRANMLNHELKTPIVANQLGDSAGALGAAALAAAEAVDRG